MSSQVDLAAFEAAFAAQAGLPSWVILPRLDSTQRLARRIVDEYHQECSEPPAMLISALEQTGGRGRRGNRWESPAGGGVYVTLVLSPVSRQALPLLPMVVGTALCRSLAEWCGDEPCRLKWPNDLFWRGAKLGGILIESKVGDDGPSALIGFGVNYLAPAGLPAAALSQLGAAVPPLPRVAGKLAADVWRAVSQPLDGATVSADYVQHSLHRKGDEIAWRHGEDSGTGRFLGFDERGFLRLEDSTTGQERALAAAEVTEPS
ncbi:MAG: biotin--[acetyl-CoA-carboxylase] ligase [Acidobacteriota bacterium]